MPEDGWYSLTVRISTAKAVRELAKAKGLTIDELLNELISRSKERLTCNLCGVKVKVTNMSRYMAKVHSK